MYKLLKPLLFTLDPEVAHNAIHRVGRFMGSPLLSWKLRLLYPTVDVPALKQDVFGLHFSNPVGLAAGFDKPGDIIDTVAALGFGYVEVGAVTPLAQTGNEKPRVFRLPSDNAVINRMGFNNDGLEVLIRNLSKRGSDIPVGANIGKNKDTANEDAADDYRTCMAVLPHVDYISVNVSSPNTPGLRELQDKGPLLEILQAVQKENVAWAATETERTGAQVSLKPVLLKIAPDMTDSQLDDVIAVVREAGADGIIATNTTASRDGLHTPAEEVEAIGMGGLSGPILRERSTEVVRYLYAASGGNIPIIGVGGIDSAEAAYEKIRAGASLVQVYTGLVYEGPGLVRRINKGLVRLLKKDGFAHIADAVGADHK